jgi:hypothetical protein
LRLGLGDVPQADAADAVAVALCHAQHLAFPASPLPAAPRRGGAKRQERALLALARREIDR